MSVLNLPNLISLSRILLTPVFLVLMARGKPRAAFLVFLIAAATDLLDGFTARLLNQKTRLGALLDPAGDKVLMTAAVIILSFPDLSSPNVLPLWLAGIILGRDVILVAGALFLHRLIGRTSFPPSWAGKAATVLQMSLIVLILYANSRGIRPGALEWLFPLTAGITLLSLLQYGRAALRWIRERGSAPESGA